ncbi:MAG TPA: hypothetical protein PKU74_05360 [Candidatus Omnitrophota bacterium]|nr:hypothetical protein [Candidatus Omnitrophota bacterium]
MRTFGFSRLGQSGTELAIFGAMLIFIIGSIIKAGMQASMLNNMQLRALRLALSESYRTSEGEYINFAGDEGSNARTSASVVILEDRLNVDAGKKFGSRDRFPMTASASASMTKNLFRPTHWGDRSDLPLSDVYINGQRFPLLGADFKSVTLANSDGSRPSWIPVCNGSAPAYFNSNAPPASPPYGLCWWNNCVSYSSCVYVGYGGNYELGYMGECVYASGGSGTGQYDLVTNSAGCTLMFTISGNYPKSKTCCFGTTCTKNCSGLPQDIRFDYDFDGVSDVPAGMRDGIMWQWFLIAGVVDGTATTLPGAWGAVPGIFVDPSGEKESKNETVDVDGDYYEESILNYSALSSGVLQTVNVIDSEEGDMSSSFMSDARQAGEWRFAGTIGGSCGATPTGNCNIGSTTTGNNTLGVCSNYKCLSRTVGFSEGAQVYTFTDSDPGQETGSGTYFRTEEGPVFTANTSQYTRSTERHDQLDVIERQVQLTRDTGRFCADDVNPRPWGTSTWARDNGVFGIPNPVEVCTRPSTGTNCYMAGVSQLTCFDRDNLMLFVRSRIADLRGRRWIRRYAP